MQENPIQFERHEIPSVSRQSSQVVCYVEHDGARLAFDFEAPRDGQQANQLLVLVNGFARPRSDFRAFRKRIHAQMPNLATLALDNRGAGESEGGIEGLSVERMAEDAAFLAQAHAAALSLQGYHALGISMGGMICQNWASRDSQVNGLILVSTTAGGDARVWPEGVEPMKLKSKAFEPWPQDVEAMQRRMSRYFGPKFRKSSPLLIEMMVKNMLNANAEAHAQGRSRAQYDATIAYDGVLSLARVSSPTLVLTGSEDEIIPPGNADALCRLIPQAKKVVFPEMGHLLLVEDPENFVAQVRTFLEAAGD